MLNSNLYTKIIRNRSPVIAIGVPMGGSVDRGGSPKSDDLRFTALSLTKYELTSYVYGGARWRSG